MVQEAISLLNENEPNEVTDEDVRHRLKYKYNGQLNFHCYKKATLYDSDCWYDFPDCLKNGGVKTALKVVRNQQFFHYLTEKRKRGIADKILFNTDTAVYDYSSLLNQE